MAGKIVIDTLEDGSGNNTSATNAIKGSAKAWVNFDGTGTVAIRAAFNVTSITDNGTGDYTVNFTTAMPDANYCANVSSGSYNGRYATIRNTSTYDVQASILTSSVRVMIASSTASPDNQDLNAVCVSIFR